jgi:cyanophycinase-like exopeptidase
MLSASRILIFAWFAFATVLASATPNKTYQYFRVGNPNDISANTQAGFVLMGGGTDVDAAFQWMCGKANGGDFLVIRATGTDAYNPYIQGLCPGLNSVATLIIPSTAAANDPFVAATIASAEALWIAGGDQSNYINFWPNTPVEAGVNNLIARGVPVGGTSAGFNVIPQFIFSALNGTITSSEALKDPFDHRVTLSENFLNIPQLTNIIGEPHFVTRDRMGRLLVFLARVVTNGWSSAPRAIAVDEKTAVLLDLNGNANVVGSSTVYFLQTPGSAQVCVPKTALTYDNVSVYRIASSGTFNLGTWSGKGGTAYTVSADAGVLSSTQANGAIY